MKGIVFKAIETVEIRDDLPKPTLKKNEVLVKVKKCGICGSDVESFLTGALILTGITLGHEFAGEIVEVGEGVKKRKVGERVTANPSLPCWKCYWCDHYQENNCKKKEGLGQTTNGALAEFVKVREERLHVLPPSVSFEEGAFVEPTAITLLAVQASGFQAGQNAVVFGAGTIGLSALQVLNAAGASEVFVIEPLEFQREKALELGATKVLEPKDWSKINKLTGKIGADHIFDCAGVPKTYIDSMKLVKAGGDIMIIGIHAEPFQMTGWLQLLLKNLTLRGTYGYTQDTFRATVNLFETKRVKVEPIITKRITLDDVPEAFETLRKPGNKEIKIMVEP